VDTTGSPSKLNISDTAAMLLPYRNSNTISQATFNWSVLDSINAPLTGLDSAQIGNTYLVGTIAIGAFAGQSNKIAERTVTYTWAFTTPTVGDYLLNNKTAFVSQWNGTVWLRISKAMVHVGGNSYSVPITIGTNDDFGVVIKTNNKPALSISASNIYGAITRFNGANGSDAFILTNAGFNSTLSLGSYGGYTTLDADGNLTARVNTHLTLLGNSTSGESVVFIKNSGSGSGNIIAAKLNTGNNLFSVKDNGNVAIGTITPHVTSILDIASTTRGVLFPRLTTAQINAIASPANGLTVYNTTENTICFFNGTNWQKVTSTNL